MANSTLHLPELYLNIVNKSAIAEEYLQIQQIVKDAINKLMTKDFKLLVIPIIEEVPGPPQRTHTKHRHLDMRFQKTLDDFI